MKVWVLLFRDGNDEENNSSLIYETKQAAQKEACLEMIGSIINGWNLSNKENLILAKKINRLVQSESFEEAIDLYENSYGSGHGYDYTWNVSQETIIQYDSVDAIPSIDFSRYTIENRKSNVYDPTPIEQPCFHCGKDNTAGVCVCWNCGKNPNMVSNND